MTGHLKLLAASRAHLHVPLIGSLLIQPLRNWMVWEDYRSHYVILTLFDTHFLLVWLVTTAAVVALYLTLRAFSPWRLLATGVLYATTSVVHVYEGVTLMAITAAVLLVCWRRQQVTPSVAVKTAAVCAVAVGGCIGLFFLLQQRSGLPAPSWQAVNILFSTFVLAYPLAWALIAWGVAGYWRRAQLEECFLLGWALGCTAVTLSGPFYPYPDRGTMTLQIPLFIIAGAIYFARRKRVGRLAAAVAILILVATPVFAVYNRWDATRFDRNAPHKFIGPQHKAILSALRGRASVRDLLIAEPDDVLWLGPEHPGRHFCGHFFLTVRYDEKCAALAQFFESPAREQVDFLQRTGARFLYVDEAREPARFARLPGLERLVATDAGALFEVRPEKRDGSR